MVQIVKNLPAMQETKVGSLGWEDPLEKGVATHSSILAWRIPWTKEPGELQSMGSQRIRHDFHFQEDSDFHCRATLLSPVLQSSLIKVMQVNGQRS